MAVSHLLAVAAIAGTAHAAPTPDELDALATAAPVAGDAPAPVTRAYELPCWCVRAEGHLGLDGRIGATTAYPLDAAGTPSASSAALSPRLRVGLSVGALRGRLRWLAEYEHDLPAGTWARGSDAVPPVRRIASAVVAAPTWSTVA